MREKDRKWVVRYYLIYALITFFLSIFGDSALFAQDIRIANYRGSFKGTNSNGGYTIENVTGDAELKANGPIRISHVKGNLSAITSVGDIEIGEAAGNIIAITQAGNITIKKADKHVYAEAELGEVTILTAQSVEVRNIFGGDVKIYYLSGYSKVVTQGNILLVIRNGNSRAELCDLTSTDGDITLQLPEALHADVEIYIPLSEDPQKETRIESDFPFNKFKQRCIEKKILFLSTRLNNGGSRIKLQIEKGNIYFRAIKAEKR